MNYLMPSESMEGENNSYVDLVDMACKGNTSALTELIIRKKDEYFRLAYSYLSNKEDALDAVQNMALSIMSNLNQLRDFSSFYSWSKTILVNNCKNMLKKRKKLNLINTLLQKHETELAVHSTLENLDDTLFLMKYVDMLSPKLQEVVKLHYFLDYDYSSISYLINVPVGTVKSRISKALSKLRAWIGGIE